MLMFYEGRATLLCPSLAVEVFWVYEHLLVERNLTNCEFWLILLCLLQLNREQCVDQRQYTLLPLITRPKKSSTYVLFIVGHLDHI